MNQEEQIKQAIKGMTAGKIITLLAKVTAVDEAAATITAELSEGLTIEDVRLRSTINGDKGFYIIPAINSQVLLLRISGSDEFHAVAFSDFDKIIARNASVSIQVTGSEIIFNDNTLGSFMPDLTKVVSKMNALETQVNNLKTILTAWVPVPSDGGAALKTAITTWAGSSMTPTVLNDLKDPKIKN